MSECACPIRRFALDATDWTPIVAPVSCSYYAILGTVGGNAILRCSDPSNLPATEHQVGGGGWYALLSPRHGPPRYAAGDTVIWLQAVQGTETAIVEFIL